MAILCFIVPDVFCAVFPFHILFDEKMEIIQFGDGLTRLIPRFTKAKEAGKTVMMFDIFTMIHPYMAICYSNIKHFMNAVFLLQINPVNGNTNSLVLKGRMLNKVKENVCFYWNGSLSWSFKKCYERFLFLVVLMTMQKCVIIILPRYETTTECFFCSLGLSLAETVA